MSSPRKTVPLAGGPLDMVRTRTNSSVLSSPSFITKRAFFCSVVFEAGHDGRPLPQDVQDILASLGTQLDAHGKPLDNDHDADAPLSSSSGSSRPLSPTDPVRRKRALTDASAFADTLNELITTERSYLRRIIALKQSYADPLRSFARSRDTAIIPAYEAKTLFGNIDALIPANEAFLVDLEKMIGPNGARIVGGIGDVALRHFKDLKTFDCYKQYYSKREEAQAIFVREVAKKSSTGFAGFIDRIQYSTAESRNRVGLSELLMDPVQRIPRYTMLFKLLIKHMPESDPQRAKLIEAEIYASKIAQCETDEQTRRAAVMYCLKGTIDGFPSGLVSHGRRLIDCIDVDDVPVDMYASSSHPSSSSSAIVPATLPCTLFLFDDRLMIVKRTSPSTSGRVLAGLDDVDKLAKAGILGATSLKKGGMSYKGVVDITDVVATDAGGASMHIFLEKEPLDQSDRWTNRPFRSLSVVNPPHPSNLAPAQLATDKTRFLENVWLAQALYRAKAGRSVPFVSETEEVGTEGKRMTLARTYFNVYQRTAYLGEPNKGKIVMHIDPTGEADPLPFGIDCGPFVIVRVQPLEGELCRYGISSSDTPDEKEEFIIRSSSVSQRIVQTIHECGLFKFRTGYTSRPSTPTATTRGRAALFNLDAIKQNLFSSSSKSSHHHRSVTSSGDFGSVNNRSQSHKRSRSYSRSTAVNSHMTGTTTTTDTSFRFSTTRSGSTAPSSVMAGDDEDGGFFSSSRPKSREGSYSPKKLFKRGRSPELGIYNSGSGSSSSPSKSSREGSRERERERERARFEFEDAEDEHGRTTETAHGPAPGSGSMLPVDRSEHDLSARLELARQNSLSQSMGGDMSIERQHPRDETIFEEEGISSSLHAPLLFDRPPSPASTFRPRSTTPTQHLDIPARPLSAMSNSSVDRRIPMGPRTPTLRPSDLELDVTNTLEQLERHASSASRIPAPLLPRTPSPKPPVPSLKTNLARKRPPPTPLDDVSKTPLASLETPRSRAYTYPRSNTVEPLSIKKKSQKSPTRNGKADESTAHVKGLSRSGTISRREKENHGISETKRGSTSSAIERTITIAAATLEDVNSSSRAVKRIKVEVDALRFTMESVPKDRPSRPLSVVGMSPRSPAARTLATREAESRMSEMRLLIERGRGAQLHLRPESPALPEWLDDHSPSSSPSAPAIEPRLKTLVGLVADAEQELQRALTSHAFLHTELEAASSEFADRVNELDKARSEVLHAQRQCEVVKKLLADATAENEIMYDAFNEELDGMFQDVNLPESEAWTAMTADLRKTKSDRNALSKENASLKRSLELTQLQNQEWEALLRAHGLIS